MTTGTATDELAAFLGERRPPLTDLLARPGTRAVLLAGSKDPNAKMTIVLLDDYGPAFVVKVPTTQPAALVIRNEGYMLNALTDRGLGSLANTLPRPIGYLAADGLPALISTALTGTPMTVRYHAWRHTARRRNVRADFAAASRWLAELQARTAGPTAPVTLLADSLKTIKIRFPDHPCLRTLLRRLGVVASLLSRQSTPRTVVHGDYWFGNLLVDGDRVVGVVDWESGAMSGEPLRDVARFAVSYALDLDKHVRPGRRVPGHRGLRAGPWGAGVVYLLQGRSWLSLLVQGYLTQELKRLGVPGELWPEVLLTGVAEIAATADHPDFARSHVDLLARMVAVWGGGKPKRKRPAAARTRRRNGGRASTPRGGGGRRLTARAARSGAG
jgi:Phosphotransferase enzyme family